MRKTIFLTYLSFVAKLIFTILSFSVFQGNFSFLSIIAIIVLPVLAYQGQLAMFCLVGLVVIVCLWLITLLFSILGIYKMKCKKVFLLHFMILTVIDFFFSLMISSVSLKIMCVLVSLLVLLLCIKAVLELHKKTGTDF